jgi:hypothetical protein
MKIKVDNEEVFELNSTKKKVIKNDIHEDEFDGDMKRRVKWVLEHKYEQCFSRLKAEWDQKLASKGIQMIPTNPDAYAELVFSQPDYMDRKTKEATSPKPGMAQG